MSDRVERVYVASVPLGAFLSVLSTAALLGLALDQFPSLLLRWAAAVLLALYLPWVCAVAAHPSQVSGFRRRQFVVFGCFGAMAVTIAALCVYVGAARGLGFWLSIVVFGNYLNASRTCHRGIELDVSSGPIDTPSPERKRTLHS